MYSSSSFTTHNISLPSTKQVTVSGEPLAKYPSAPDITLVEYVLGGNELGGILNVTI